MEDNRGKTRRIPHGVARTAALPWAGGAGVDWSLLDGRGWLSRNVGLEIEQRRLFPWIAVCFGLGVVLFFQADGQPALWAPLGALALYASAAIALRRSLPAFSVMIAVAAVFAGFSAGAIRTRSVAAPVLSRVMIVPLTGFIEAVEDREGVSGFSCAS
ncbi:hypothetical protein ACFQY9_14090 [Microvirga aerilata]|uniref:hypothetical protein n=1 Tax=Microvirga aerilata TaxID=670292 RepID=UPI00362D1D31